MPALPKRHRRERAKTRSGLLQHQCEMTALGLGSAVAAPVRLRCPARVALGFKRSSLLAIDALVQPLAGLEVQGVPRGNRHRRSGAGVAANSRRAVTEREAGEAPDLDAPAPGETFHHLVEHPLHRELDIALAEIGVLERNALDQLRSRHRPIVPLFSMRGGAVWLMGASAPAPVQGCQAEMFALHGGIVGEARIVERAFGVGPCVLTEAMAWLQDRLASAET